MTSRCLSLVLVVLCALSLPAQALPIVCTVECVGTESGGDGGPHNRQYCYKVTLGSGHTMDLLEVGTWDMNLGNYTNWEALDEIGNDLAGWYWGLASESQESIELKTPHGAVSPGPTTMTPGIMYWTSINDVTNGVFYLGVDNPNNSWDVGFHMEPCDGGGLDEDWSEPVGWGRGPVHGPIPEPATMTLLALAGLALMRRRA